MGSVTIPSSSKATALDMMDAIESDARLNVELSRYLALTEAQTIRAHFTISANDKGNVGGLQLSPAYFALSSNVAWVAAPQAFSPFIHQSSHFPHQ